MEILLLISEFILFIWFMGCTITYRLGKHTLVDGMGIRSAEFVMLLIYGTGILITLFYPNVGQWLVLFILLFWIIIQFFCHWFFTIFGASNVKVMGYNKCFQHTLRIFPQSNKRIIPDFYHMVLHMLIILNIIISLVTIVH